MKRLKTWQLVLLPIVLLFMVLDLTGVIDVPVNLLVALAILLMVVPSVLERYRSKENGRSP
ncbi:hypothetical protein ACE1TI_00085 [Alteribacillus sp. JSM 102045]|uniref:hypothetical protein n=1 Tax=Alteribacillus sp. JSM 102045 TaxID=1562101 RepID=UPI0035C0005D